MLPNMDRLAEDWYRKWDPEFDDDDEDEDEDEENEDEELGDCDEYDIAQDSKLMEDDHAN